MYFAFIFESVGGTEWLVLLGVALIVVGPKNLPSAARKLGEITTKLRRAADEFKRQLMSMDQEVRSAVNDAVSDVKDAYTDVPEGTSPEAGEASVPPSDSSDEDRAEPYDPYSEGNPYPGYGDSPDYYKDAAESDAVPEDVAAVSDVAADVAPAPADRIADLKKVTITVSKAPEAKA